MNLFMTRLAPLREKKKTKFRLSIVLTSRDILLCPITKRSGQWFSVTNNDSDNIQKATSLQSNRTKAKEGNFIERSQKTKSYSLGVFHWKTLSKIGLVTTTGKVIVDWKRVIKGNTKDLNPLRASHLMLFSKSIIYFLNRINKVFLFICSQIKKLEEFDSILMYLMHTFFNIFFKIV
jgi:hypothetical protein